MGDVAACLYQAGSERCQKTGRDGAQIQSAKLACHPMKSWWVIFKAPTLAVLTFSIGWCATFSLRNEP